MNALATKNGPRTPRATVNSQVAVGLASVVAPLLVASPFLTSLAQDAWPTIFGLAGVAALIAAVLLVGVTPTSERDPLEVGLIWAFAGAGTDVAGPSGHSTTRTQ